MPPTFRSSRSGRQFADAANRNRTGQIDHDVFEGLPVRRWTRQTQTVSQEPKVDIPDPNDFQGLGGKPTIPEHPMPRDSHLLTPMSRALLRAARAGCIYIRQAPKEADEEEKEATDGEEQQQPLVQSTERSFVTRKWATIPKHLEAVEVEFLAKRRPGLPSLYGESATNADGSSAGPMRRTRFKKVDPATGNISIYEAWVPEGHKIEGEITDDIQVAAPSSKVTVTPEAPAPGTVIEGVGVVNAEGVVVAEAGSENVMTPPKRRPPPPKRKAKGVGKGRRKKVMFAPGDGADASQVHGAGGTDGAADREGDNDSSRLSVDQAGQDDDEEEGEEGDETDDGDESMLDAKTPETSVPPTSTEPSAAPEPTSAPTLAVGEPQPSNPDPSSAVLSEMPSQPPVPSMGLSGPLKESADTPSPALAQKSIEIAPLPADVEMADAIPSQEHIIESASLQVSSSEEQTIQERFKTGPVPSQNTPQSAVSEIVPATASTKQASLDASAFAPFAISGETAGQPMNQPQLDGDTIMGDSAAAPEVTSELDSEKVAPEPLNNVQSREESTDTQETDILGTLEASLDSASKTTQPATQANEPGVGSIGQPGGTELAAEATSQTDGAEETTVAATQAPVDATSSSLEQPVGQLGAPDQGGQATQPPSEQAIAESASGTPVHPTGQIPDHAAAPPTTEKPVIESAIEQQQPQSEEPAIEQSASPTTERPAAVAAAAPVDTTGEMSVEQVPGQPTSTDQPSEAQSQSQPSTETPEEQKQPSAEIPAAAAAAAAASELTPVSGQQLPPQEQQPQPETEGPQSSKRSAPSPPAPELPAEESRFGSVTEPQKPQDQPQEPEIQATQPTSPTTATQGEPSTESQPPSHPEPSQSVPDPATEATDQPAGDSASA